MAKTHNNITEMLPKHTKRLLLLSTVFLATTGFAYAQLANLEEVRYMPGSYRPIPVSKTYFNYESNQQQRSDLIPLNPEPAPDMSKKQFAPVLGADGSFVFPYGPSLPSVICAPFHLCEVRLQPGETIQQLDVGDTARWQVKLARSVQDGVETSHLIIKPSEVGIVSNLVAITDKRTYTMQLVSKKDRSWMPKVSFSYPDDIQANWKAYFAENQSRQSNNMLVNNSLSAPTLDFKYRIKGDKPSWRPIQVYTDQVKTYIQLPSVAKNDEVPVLVLLGPGDTEQLVNYRLDGNKFVVDKVIHHASLISGVGRNQERVEIIKGGG